VTESIARYPSVFIDLLFKKSSIKLVLGR